MGDAILSILMELCKLLTFVSVCTCNVQICSPGKAISEQVKGGDGAERDVRVAQRVEAGVWEPAIAISGGAAPPRKPMLAMLTGRPDGQDAECSGSGATGRLGEQGFGSCPRPHTSLPAPAPSASSSSGWCAEKNIVALLKRLKRACASPRGVLARGRCDGNVTQRGGAAPAHALQEHVPGRLEELLAFQRCAGFVKREEFILSSCQSVTSRRLSAFPPRPPPPRCHCSQMCAVPGAAKFPVPRQGNRSIFQTSPGESEHLPNLTRLTPK